MAEEVVGSAYVVIRAIANKIRDDIKDGVKKSAAGSELDRAGQEVGDKIGEAAGTRVSEKISKHVTDDVTKHQSDYDRAGSLIGKAMSDSLINVPSFRNIGKRIAGFFTGGSNSSAAGGAGAKMGKKLGTEFGKGISSIPLLPFILTMLVPALGGVLKLISAYVASAVSLLSSMGPAIAGGAAAGISTYLALGQAIGAVTLALKAQSPLLKAFKTELKGLQRDFKDVGRAVQATLLPTLGKNLKSIANDILPILKKRFADTGSVLAGVSTQFVHLAASPIFQRNFGRVLGTNNLLLGYLGTALKNLVSLFVTLLAAARPVVLLFGRWAATQTAAANATALHAQKVGTLRDFFLRAAASMQQWGRIISNFGHAFGTILGIASKSGQTLTDRIETLSARFRAFTDSIGGRNKIATFFQNALPIVQAFNKLVGAAFKTLGSTLGDQGSTKNMVKFINMIRTQLLPALAQMASALSQMGPHLILLATAFANLLTVLANSGALGAFTTTLNGIIGILTKILSMPVVGQLAAWALGFAGAAKAVDLVLKPLGGLKIITGPIGEAIGRVVDHFGGLSAILKIAGKGLLGFVGTLGRLAGSFLVAIGPIGWVILALVALGAGLVILWKKSETFRNIVTGVWGAIKGAVASAVGWITGTALPAIEGFFTSIGSAIGGAFGAVSGAITGALGAAVSWITGTALPAITGFLSAIKGAVTGAFSAVAGGVRTAVGAIGKALSAAFAPIRAAWQMWWGTFGPLVKAVFNLIVAIVKLGWVVIKGLFLAGLIGMRAVVSAGWNAIVSITSRVWGALSGIVSSVWGGIQRAVHAGVAIVKTGISVGWNAVRTITVKVWNALAAPIRAAWSKIQAATRAGVAIVRAGITAGWHAVRAVTNTVWNGLLAFFRAIWARIKAVVSPAVNAIKNTISSAWNAVKSATSRAWNAFVSTIKSAVGRAVGAVRNIGGQVRNAVSNFGSLLINAGRALIDGLVSGITSKIGAVTSAIGRLTSIVKGHLPGSPIRLGPLRSWNNGGAGKRLVNLLAQGLSDTAPITAAMDKVASAVKLDALKADVNFRSNVANGAASAAFATRAAARRDTESLAALLRQLIDAVNNLELAVTLQGGAGGRMTASEAQSLLWSTTKKRG